MARSLNKAQLIGNMATDPQIKYLPNGSMVCSFVVATNRRYTKSDGTVQEEAEFSPISAWGKLAEVCQKILAKGMLVFIEGRLRTRQWEGQDGVKRSRTEIRALDVILLDSKDREPAGLPDDAPGGSGDSDDDDKDDDSDKKSKSKAEISDEELEEILSDTGDDDDEEGDEVKDGDEGDKDEDKK